VDAPEMKRCPQCEEELKVMLLLGVAPDGYVCEKCEIYYNDNIEPLARVLIQQGDHLCTS
jgi:hypothetical protein